MSLVRADQAALAITSPANVTYGTTATATVSGGSSSGALSFRAGGSTGCGVDANSGLVSVTNASGSCALVMLSLSGLPGG